MSTVFEVPSGGTDTGTLPAHTHAIGEVVGLAEELEQKAPLGHTHAISAVSGLAEELTQLETNVSEAKNAAAASSAAIGDVASVLDALNGEEI